MKAITLRKIPAEVARAISRKAETEGISLNKAVVDLLEERLGIGGRKPARTRHSDLDFLFGSWTRREGEQFDEALREQRVIDPDMWK